MDGQNVPTTLCDDPFPAPVLCERAGLDTIQANFIILVDESGSMATNRLWDPVIAATEDLADAIPASDELRLLFFAGQVREHQQPWGADSVTREAWKRSVAGRSDPRGDHTDLGRAVEAAFRIIQAEPPERQQFVVILTDGVQDPAEESSYDQTGNSAAWEELRERAEMASEARPLSITLLRLSEDADQSLLSRMLPDLKRVDAIGAEDLRMWVQRWQREFQVEKLALALREEDESALAVLEVVEAQGAPVRLRHGRSETVDAHLRSGRSLSDLDFERETRLELGTDRSLTMPPAVVPADSLEVLSVKIRDTSGHPLLPPGWRKVNFDIRVNASAVRGPEEELGRLTLSPETDAAVRIHGSYRVGGILPNWPTYITALVLVVGLLLMLLVLARWRLHRPDLQGWTLVRRSGSESSDSDPINLSGTSYEAHAGDGGALFVIRARSHRAKTRVSLEAKVPMSDLQFNRPNIDTGDLKAGTTVTVPTEQGDIVFTLMRRGRR